MKYWQLIYRTGEEGYETKELLLTNDQHIQIRKALADGMEFLMLPGGATIKRNQLASINDAGHIVREYQNGGQNLFGLPAPEVYTLRGGGPQRSSKEAMAQKIKERHFDLYARMQWKHEPTCICRGWKVEEEVKQ